MGDNMSNIDRELIALAGALAEPTKKLTDAQKTAIGKVFTKHRITITDKWLKNLFWNIEKSWAKWEYCKCFDKRQIIGKGKMRAEIEYLRYALKKLNPSTRRALIFCSMITPTMGRLENTRKLDPLLETLYDNYTESAGRELNNVADIAFEVLIESCNEALERGGPAIFGGRNAVDEHAKKAGRPHNKADVDLIKSLGIFYRYCVDKIPSETPHGAFDDFLAAVFNVIAPRRERADFRKLIRAAFPRNVPKSP